MKQFVLVAIIGLLSITCFPNYLEKAELEKGLQIKAQHVLDTMYGPHNFSVLATVELGNESWQVSYTERANVEFTEQKNTTSEKYKILPGYSAIKNLSPNEAVQMPFNSKISKQDPPILKLTLDIITNNEFSKKDVKAADKIITKLLNLNTDRGDSINFIFEQFPVKMQEEVKVGMPLEAKIMFGIMALSSVFIIVYILLQIKQLDINKQAVKAQKETAKATATAGAASSAPTVPDATSDTGPVSAPVSGDSDAKGYFSFVGPHNAAQFVEVVKQSELSNDQIAIVASYIDPSYAKSIISQYDDQRQLEIIQELSNEKKADKDDLDDIEDELKTQLECTIGGATKLGALVATFGDASKKNFLGSIQANPEVYNKIRPGILLFEDIEKLDDGDIKKLIGVLNIESVAAAIAKSDDAASKKIKANLTGAAEAMVSQFIDLKKDSLTDNDVTNAQSQVVHQLKHLSDSGTIDIVSKLVS